MFKEEAEWIGAQVKALPFSGVPFACLNLGSSTRAYREVNQPHVFRCIFEPLGNIATVMHVDIKHADGVDLAGDFMDEEFWKKIPARSFDLVMCCNLLTHVTDPTKVFRLICRSVSPGGYVVISAPNMYPYCADPLDTMYRPSASDLIDHFPGHAVLATTEIKLSETHFSRLRHDPKATTTFVANVLMPIRGLTRWKAVVSDVPNLLKPLSTVCVILRAPHLP